MLKNMLRKTYAIIFEDWKIKQTNKENIAISLLDSSGAVTVLSKEANNKDYKIIYPN